MATILEEIDEALDDIENEFPEYIDAAMGDRVFSDQDGYWELRESWKEMRRSEVLAEFTDAF